MEYCKNNTLISSQAEDLSDLTKSFEFLSFEQAQHFVQRVGRFCNEKDHHPEWQTSNEGKTISARLTSHFAGNKVTLYDFQLAENMNKSYTITLKEYNAYPKISPKTIASFNIYMLTFFVGAVLFNYGYYWGENYVPAAQRGNFYESLPRPIQVKPFVLNATTLEQQKDLDQWVEDNLDDYAFKTSLFTSRGIF